MSESTSTVACPNGHASVDRGSCSVCGTWIPDLPLLGPDGGPITASTPTVVHNPGPIAPSPLASPSRPSSPSGPAPTGPGAGPAASLGGGGECPYCSSELDAGTRFCEVCGYDPATGSLPSAPVPQPVMLPPTGPPPAPARSSGTGYTASGPTSPSAAAGASGASRLLAVVTADRAYYESQQVAEVQFPVGAPPRVIELPAGPATIGRRSRSLGTDPAVDLAVPPEDPAVSHSHASLLPAEDGTWALVDHGSTNGTYLNESREPLPAHLPRTVRPGDRIYVGAWTRISLELRP